MWHLDGNTWHCSSYQTFKCPFHNKSEVKMWKNKGWGTKWKVKVLAGLHKQVDTCQSTHERGNVVRPFPKVMKESRLVSKLIQFYSIRIVLFPAELCFFPVNILKNRLDKITQFCFHAVNSCILWLVSVRERGIPWLPVTSAWCPYPYRGTISNKVRAKKRFIKGFMSLSLWFWITIKHIWSRFGI